MIPNPRKPGVARVLARDQLSVVVGDLPGVGTVVRLAVADVDSGAEAEIYLTMMAALNLSAQLASQIRAATGITPTSGILAIGGGRL